MYSRALLTIPPTDVTALFSTAPVFVFLLSIVILREPPLILRVSVSVCVCVCECVCVCVCECAHLCECVSPVSVCPCVCECVWECCSEAVV